MGGHPAIAMMQRHQQRIRARGDTDAVRRLAERHPIRICENARELAPALPIVVLSADDRPETVLGAIDRGADGGVRRMK